MTNRIRALDGVTSTETFVYLELRKQLYDWGAVTVPQAADARERRQADGDSAEIAVPEPAAQPSPSTRG